jgi:diphthamide synthase (EF-2-diphthine--ammonia ligase)
LKAKILLSWSSGKDSAWTLHTLVQRGEVEVAGPLTTINTHFQRVAMHGTRCALLKAQAEAVRLPLWEVPLPWPCSNEVYEQAMAKACASAVEKRNLRHRVSATSSSKTFAAIEKIACAAPDSNPCFRSGDATLAN